MRNLTSRFVALATASALITGCSTQQASTPQASAASVAAPDAPLCFGWFLDQREIRQACWKMNWPLSLPHTFRETGDTASASSPGGITSKMTQTSPGVYAANYYTFANVRLRAVVDAASSPKSISCRQSSSTGELSFQWCSPLGQERDRTGYRDGCRRGQ